MVQVVDYPKTHVGKLIVLFFAKKILQILQSNKINLKLRFKQGKTKSLTIYHWWLDV